MTFYLNTDDQLNALSNTSYDLGWNKGTGYIYGIDKAEVEFAAAVQASRRTPADDIVRLLDNWCHERVLSEPESRILDLAKGFLADLLRGHTNPIAEVRERPPVKYTPADDPVRRPDK